MDLLDHENLDFLYGDLNLSFTEEDVADEIKDQMDITTFECDQSGLLPILTNDDNPSSESKPPPMFPATGQSVELNWQTLPSNTCQTSSNAWLSDLSLGGEVDHEMTNNHGITTSPADSCRQRHTSSSTTSSAASLTPQPSSLSKSHGNRPTQGRRTKKYESENKDDPTVKNAIAAKLSRDKKKKLLQELQSQVNHLKPENQMLREELAKISREKAATEQEWRQKCETLQAALSEKRQKNPLNYIPAVKMYDYMQTFIQGLPQSTPTVFMSSQLANLPMPNPTELPEIRRTIQESPHSSPHDDTTSLTVKVGVGTEPTIHFGLSRN